MALHSYRNGDRPRCDSSIGSCLPKADCDCDCIDQGGQQVSSPQLLKMKLNVF